MMDAVNEYHRDVHVWLEQIFANGDVPQYELNNQTIYLLHQLKQKNCAKNSDTVLVTEDLRQKSAEYAVEARRISSVLAEVDWLPACLSQSGVTSLSTLADLALLLQVKDVSDTSILLAVQNLQLDISAMQDSLLAEQRSYRHLLRVAKTTVIKHSALLKAYQQLEEQATIQQPEVEKRSGQILFFSDKCKEYKKLIATKQKQLINVKVDESLYHSSLIKMFENLKELNKKNSLLQTKIDSYHDLPPDMPQSKVKIEELKLKVAKLEEELAQKIDAMHM